MRVKLQLSKDGAALSDGIYDITDADSFGKACKELWIELRERSMQKRTSIGDLFDSLDQWLVDQLNGARLDITRAD